MLKSAADLSPITLRRPLGLIAVMLAAAITFSGCNGGRVGETTTGGAVFGAGLGLLVGALAGKPGEGLAAGAAVGAAQGAYEGWRQEQDDQRTREITSAIREAKASAGPSGGDAASRAREELTRFLGVWSLDGWAMEGDQRLDVQATMQGNVEMSNFVELAIMDVRVGGQAVTIWGESIFGFDDDVGYTYSSRINTVPEPFRATGRFDSASRTFTFTSGGTEMVIRFDSPDRFTLETIDGGRKIESYQCTRT